jgi:hypothetical protein
MPSKRRAEERAWMSRSTTDLRVCLAARLAAWAAAFRPDPSDEALARRAFVDTIAVALAARREPVTLIATGTAAARGIARRF